MPDAITPYTVLPVWNHLFPLWCLTPSFSCMHVKLLHVLPGCNLCTVLPWGAVTPRLSGESSIFCAGAITLYVLPGCNYSSFAKVQSLYVLLGCNHSMFSRLLICQSASTSWFAKGCDYFMICYRVRSLHDMPGRHHMFFRGAITSCFAGVQWLPNVAWMQSLQFTLDGKQLLMAVSCQFFFFLISSMVFLHGISHLPVSISFHDINYVFIFPQNN